MKAIYITDSYANKLRLTPSDSTHVFIQNTEIPSAKPFPYHLGQLAEPVLGAAEKLIAAQRLPDGTYPAPVE
jgi:hypothetical protein